MGDQHYVWATFQPGKKPSAKSRGGPGSVCMGLAKIKPLYPTGVRSPDRPACSKSLYWLSYVLLKFISDFIDGKFAIILLFSEFDNISPLCWSVINSPVHTVTRPELFYIQFITSYYVCQSFVWPLSGRKQWKYKNDRCCLRGLHLTISYLNTLNITPISRIMNTYNKIVFISSISELLGINTKLKMVSVFVSFI